MSAGETVVLTPEQQDALACRCHEGLCPLHNEASDGYVEHKASDLLTVVKRIVAEQVTAVLDEVERRIERKLSVTSRALPIVREVRRSLTEDSEVGS